MVYLVKHWILACGYSYCFVKNGTFIVFNQELFHPHTELWFFKNNLLENFNYKGKDGVFVGP